jgi:hypothetical protein
VAAGGQAGRVGDEAEAEPRRHRGQALDYVSRALEKRGITAFDQDRSTDRTNAVERTVGASLELLGADDQRRWAKLAIFPEDEAIPVRTAALLWEMDDLDAEDFAAARLDDFALVDLDLRRGNSPPARRAPRLHEQTPARFRRPFTSS